MTAVLEKNRGLPLHLPLHKKVVVVPLENPYVHASSLSGFVVIRRNIGGVGLYGENERKNSRSYRKTTMTNSHSATKQDSLLISVDEACGMLSISRGTFYKELAAGRLLIVKIGRASRVPTTSLVQYCENRITEANAQREKNLKGWQ